MVDGFGESSYAQRELTRRRGLRSLPASSASPRAPARTSQKPSPAWPDRIGALAATRDTDAPAAAEALVERFEPAVCFPMHARGLGREPVVEPQGPVLAATLF